MQRVICVKCHDMDNDPSPFMTTFGKFYIYCILYIVYCILYLVYCILFIILYIIHLGVMSGKTDTDRDL